jgi:hypothetical protein
VIEPLLDEHIEIGADPSTVFDAAWLRSKERPRHEDLRGSVGIVDLFCGCGVLTEASPWTSYWIPFGLVSSNLSM